MTPLDFSVLFVLLADYCVAVPAFLSSGSVLLILLGVVLAVVPGFLVYHRFFKGNKKC